MKFNFRKVASTLASVAMLSSTVGFAAAAAWPAPFVENGVGDVTVVYPGVDAAADTDGQYATTLATTLGGLLDDGDDDGPVVQGDGWLVDSKNSILEFSESLSNVKNSIDDDELEILAEGVFVDGEYTQKITLADTSSSSVYYTVDDINFDDDMPGLYLVVDDEAPIFEYDMTFTSPKAKSELDTGELVDFVNSDISLLGTTYTVTKADFGDGDIELNLMGGAEKVTLASGSPQVVDGHSISVSVRDSDDVVFTVDGVQGRSMDVNDVKEINGVFIAVTDIAYQSYAGGLAEASFFVGGDKLELTNGQELAVNAESIDGTLVTIGYTNTTVDEIDLT